jgi:uncharacterized membrane protein YebE (DUF533 family)
MSITNLLGQLLKSGAGVLQNQQNPQAGGWQQQAPAGKSAIEGFLTGKGGAALAGGVLGLLLGSKQGRKMGGSVLAYGGMAALGAIAYKAYTNWQVQQQTGTAEPQTLDRVPASQVEDHSRAILVALIAAAKADGHVDDRERQLIEGEVAKLTQDSSLLSWVDSELKRPLDPASVATHARTPEIAAEMYLASVLAVDEESFMEKAYLQELARQLKLDPALQQELTRQAKQAMVVAEQ